jgi:hypothetical protein
MHPRVVRFYGQVAAVSLDAGYGPQ